MPRPTDTELAPPPDGAYDDRRTTGFVVQQTTTLKNGRMLTSYWYGEGLVRYWNTWGDLDSSVAWFDTKVKANLARRRMGLANRPGTRTVPVAEAKANLAAELEARAAKLLARAALLRGEVASDA